MDPDDSERIGIGIAAEQQILPRVRDDREGDPDDNDGNMDDNDLDLTTMTEIRYSELFLQEAVNNGRINRSYRHGRRVHGFN